MPSSTFQQISGVEAFVDFKVGCLPVESGASQTHPEGGAQTLRSQLDWYLKTLGI